MSVHLEKTIHPALCGAFLLCVSFSIVSQLAYLLYKLYCIVDQSQQLSPCCEDPDTDQAARILLHGTRKSRHPWRHLKFWANDLLLVECPKFYLMIMALMSVTDKWKILNLFIFVLIFALFLIIQLIWEERTPSPVLAAPVCPYETFTRQALRLRKFAHATTYFMAVLCISHFAYLHWNRFLVIFTGHHGKTVLD